MAALRNALLAVSIFVPGIAFAHGGGLDGYGCHHNRKAGGYHCHRGTMAGQSFSSQHEMLQAMRKQGKKPTPYAEADAARSTKPQKQ